MPHKELTCSLSPSVSSEQPSENKVDIFFLPFLVEDYEKKEEKGKEG